MVLTSVLALLGIGVAAAAALAIASRALRVEENPLVEEVTEALPGANCGGCGFAGCEAYAVAVVTSEEIPANLCTVGGAECAEKVGLASGKAVQANDPLVAFRRCCREEGHVQRSFEYVGAATCASAAILQGGPYMCTWACLGLGDCLRACPFDAMYIENSMVEVIDAKCVSCGQCVAACPRSIMQLIPRRARVMIHCATREKLKDVSDVCDVGCINCLKCLKACPADAITYEKRRIEIAHGPCLAYGSSCGEACVSACPRFILRHRAQHFGPFAADSAAEAPSGEAVPQEAGPEHILPRDSSTAGTSESAPAPNNTPTPGTPEAVDLAGPGQVKSPAPGTTAQGE